MPKLQQQFFVWGVLHLWMLNGSCAYPKKSTTLIPAPLTHNAVASALPPNMYGLTVVSAEILPKAKGDREWDEDGLPDPYVRILKNGAVIWETTVQENMLNPVWNEGLPKNVVATSDVGLQIEVWDRDGISEDAIGFYTIPFSRLTLNNERRIMLDSGSMVVVKKTLPQGYRGVGVSEYEIREDGLKIISVLPYSPASRAQLSAGDHVVSIGGMSVKDMSAKEAETRFSLASQNKSKLNVLKSSSGSTVEVQLDDQPVWLVM